VRNYCQHPNDNPQATGELLLGRSEGNWEGGKIKISKLKQAAARIEQIPKK